jgi:hypothetical protein
MALREIRFDRKGGPVTVEIVFGYVQVGAYAVVLWNTEGKSRRKLGEGINTDQVPDVYSLPSPIADNDGSILDCTATILGGNPGPDERYRVDMIVRQNGVECGREYDEGMLASRSVSTRLAVRLVC